MRAPDLAESITGRVRAALHEGMRLAGPDLICAHTDGLWSFDGVRAPEGWREKLRGRELRLLNPQLLAWRETSSSPWEYLCSGIPSWRAEEHFERAWEEALARAQGRPWALGGPVPGVEVPRVEGGRRRLLRAVQTVAAARIEVRVFDGEEEVHVFVRATARPSTEGLQKMIEAAAGWLQAYSGQLTEGQWAADVRRARLLQPKEGAGE